MESATEKPLSLLRFLLPEISPIVEMTEKVSRHLEGGTTEKSPPYLTLTLFAIPLIFGIAKGERDRKKESTTITVFTSSNGSI